MFHFIERKTTIAWEAADRSRIGQPNMDSLGFVGWKWMCLKNVYIMMYHDDIQKLRPFYRENMEKWWKMMISPWILGGNYF